MNEKIKEYLKTFVISFLSSAIGILVYRKVTKDTNEEYYSNLKGMLTKSISQCEELIEICDEKDKMINELKKLSKEAIDVADEATKALAKEILKRA